jgi:membrane-associated phospholipid phosphatase
MYWWRSTSSRSLNWDPTALNLTDRVYVAVHVALGVLVCTRYQRVEHWPSYLAWNLCAIALILLLARQRHRGAGWEFAHDWLPAVFFITVFEEVSYLSLSLRATWKDPYVAYVETILFNGSPAVWMHLRAAGWLVQFLEFGYLAFYPLYPAVGGLFWIWRERQPFTNAFRKLTDALSVGYLICYTTYLLFPTRSPANNLGVQQFGAAQGGLFQSLVRLIQNHAGVHGNAFPSAHIMLAFVVLVFVYRFLPRLAPWLLFPILLMCVGAVYDGYHYASDVIVGALLGIVAGLTLTCERLPGPGNAIGARGRE